jgi:hypothetical protein
MKQNMKKAGVFTWLLICAMQVSAQMADCNLFCVTNIELDTTDANTLLVTIYNGDASISHINYPYIDFIIDNNGDTIANEDWSGGFFAHLGNTSQTYTVATLLDTLPTELICTVYLRYSLLIGGNGDTTCVLPYPCLNTSIEQNKNTSVQMKVYPNPAGQFTTVSFTYPNQENYTLIMYDAYGRIVRSISEIKAHQIVIEKGDLTNGIYFIRLQNGMQVLGLEKITFN